MGVVPELLEPLQELEVVLHPAPARQLRLGRPGSRCDATVTYLTSFSTGIGWSHQLFIPGPFHLASLTHLVNLVLLERFLQDLEIVQVLVLVLGAELDPLDRDVSWVEFSVAQSKRAVAAYRRWSL